jgi:WD40 repeat protein
MNIDKLQQLYDVFTDVELIISDSVQNIHICADKIILSCYSEYFFKLFTFGDLGFGCDNVESKAQVNPARGDLGEFTGKFIQVNPARGDNKSKSKFELIVNDAQISHEIILSFYGKKVNSTNYPHWKYILKKFIYRDFFSLPNDVSLLYNLKVPSEGFDLLLETMELFDDFTNDRKLMITIKNNFPDNYNLENLSPELIKELNEIYTYKIGFCNERSIKICDVDDNSIRILEEYTDPMYRCMAISSDNSKIAAVDTNRNVKIWDTESGFLLHTIQENVNSHCHIVFSPDGQKIALSGIHLQGGYTKIKIWDLHTGNFLHEYRFGWNISIVSNIVFSNDSNKIIFGCCDRTVKIWNIETDTLDSIYSHEVRIQCVALSLDNSKIISGDNNGYIKIWNKITNKLFSPTGNPRLTQIKLSDFLDPRAPLAELHTLKNIHTLTNIHTFLEENHIASVAITSDNAKIISAYNKYIDVWDVNTSKLLHTINRHGSWITHLEFSPDNRLFISCGDEVIIYDANTYEILKRIDSGYGTTVKYASIWQVYKNLNGKMH